MNDKDTFAFVADGLVFVINTNDISYIQYAAKKNPKEDTMAIKLLNNAEPLIFTKLDGIGDIFNNIISKIAYNKHIYTINLMSPDNSQKIFCINLQRSMRLEYDEGRSEIIFRMLNLRADNDIRISGDQRVFDKIKQEYLGAVFGNYFYNNSTTSQSGTVTSVGVRKPPGFEY